MNEKPECQGCGYTEYEGKLKECPFCGGQKCSACDIGDDVECMQCENEDDYDG